MNTNRVSLDCVHQEQPSRYWFKKQGPIYRPISYLSEHNAYYVYEIIFPNEDLEYDKQYPSKIEFGHKVPHTMLFSSYTDSSAYLIAMPPLRAKSHEHARGSQQQAA